MLPGKGQATFTKALAPSFVGRPIPGTFIGVDVQFASALASGTYYLFCIDAVSLPANGTVTCLCDPHAIEHTTGHYTNFSWNFDRMGGIYASTGIVIAISTTQFSGGECNLTITGTSALNCTVYSDAV